MRKQTIPLLGCIISLAWTLTATAGVTDWEGKQLILQPLPNSSRWVHAWWQGQYYTANLSRSRLFRTRKPETVSVRRVKVRKERPGFVSNTDIDFELESEHLGRGKIRFVNAEEWPKPVWEEMLPIFFAGEGVRDQARFLGSTSSHFLHFRGCNHLPPPGETKEFRSETEGTAAGYPHVTEYSLPPRRGRRADHAHEHESCVVIERPGPVLSRSA